jgi:hypothetical protein
MPGDSGEGQPSPRRLRQLAPKGSEPPQQSDSGPAQQTPTSSPQRKPAPSISQSTSQQPLAAALQLLKASNQQSVPQQPATASPQQTVPTSQQPATQQSTSSQHRPSTATSQQPATSEAQPPAMQPPHRPAMPYQQSHGFALSPSYTNPYASRMQLPGIPPHPQSATAPFPQPAQIHLATPESSVVVDLADRCKGYEIEKAEVLGKLHSPPSHYVLGS